MNYRGLETRKLVDLMAEFGFWLNVGKEPELEKDHDYWNEAVYLEEQGLVELHPAEGGFAIELVDTLGEEMARKLDSKKASYSSLEELVDSEVEPKEILEPGTENSIEIQDYRLENPSINAILYPFGRASLKGNSERELLDRHVERETGLRPENHEKLLAGILEKVYDADRDRRYWRLNQDNLIIDAAESVTREIHSDYNGDAKKYVHENLE